MAKQKSVTAASETIGVPTVQVLRNFKSYEQKKFEPFLQKVMQCSLNNPYKVPPKEVTDPCQVDLNAYIVARTNRDANPLPANTQFLDAANTKAGLTFEALALWVENNCDNNIAIAMSYGFKVAKKVRTAAKLLPAPTDVKHGYGQPGTIVFKTKSLGTRVEYIVECEEVGKEGSRRICGTSTKSFQIIATGLTRGKEYIFWIYGKNAAGPGLPWISGSIVAAA